jgi:2-phospho-L-lactate guanylyltransferase
MKTFAIVPVKRFENGKTRLSSLLSLDERIVLSSYMLEYTLQVLCSSPSLKRVVVVSVDRYAEEITSKYGARFLREQNQSGVNSAIALADKYCTQENAEATIVIPYDLPLLDTIDISMAIDLAQYETRCIVISPSLRYDGTNLLLRKPPSVMRTFYDIDSYKMHVKTAISLDLPVKYLLSRGIMHDLDTPEDTMRLANEVKASKILDFIRSKH